MPRKVLSGTESRNLITTTAAWKPWDSGFARDGKLIVCDNGRDRAAARGAGVTVVLNQKVPRPIVARAWSKAEGVDGSADSDYSLYLDLEYADGTPEWGVTAPFRVGTHGWERVEARFTPSKPVRSVTCHLLLRRHAGRARFRGTELRELSFPAGTVRFDGLSVRDQGARPAGFLVRDVAKGGDFVPFSKGKALGLELSFTESREGHAVFISGAIRDKSRKDRAITLVYVLPVVGTGVRWLAGPGAEEPAVAPKEYAETAAFQAGTGSLSRWPLAAVASSAGGSAGTSPGETSTRMVGRAIALDMMKPAFFRVGYSAGTKELYIAYDLGLAKERPSAEFRFCTYAFDPAWGFRSALAALYRVFPAQFVCRTPAQGLWMPFQKISEVKGWEDFGFRFKEGNDEVPWDDAHGIVTFRYTEPQTWWMDMPKGMPRTIEAALSEAKRRAAKGEPSAKALLSSGYHNEQGRFAARLLDTPWTDGAVWSMNSSPGIRGKATDFGNKWNAELKDRLYGPARKGDLDGEYIDSAEGYVTDELDFRRDHFGGASTPLTFGGTPRRPAAFRGLIVFEYVEAIARDVHGMGKLMMANSTPDRLCWLVPLLDVMGTEWDWNPDGEWRPMSVTDLLYRRGLCGPKPYCFLQNTDFDRFPAEKVERYMKRCLAFGMFPGFFSHNASEGHYFSRPELYDRDRPLFRKYVPLIRLVAEAGWEPETMARTGDPRVLVERFGRKYLTVFNDSPEVRTVTLSLEGTAEGPARELVNGTRLEWKGGKAELGLDSEDVALVELPAGILLP